MINFLDWLYPPRCMLCENIIAMTCDSKREGEYRYLCELCMSDLEYITESQSVCIKCGCPVNAENIFCIDCAGRDLHFDKNFPAYIYDGTLTDLIHKIKYGRKPGYAKGLGYLAAKNIPQEVMDMLDLITAVPMHYKKQRRRGYNQAVIIAEAVGEYFNKPVAADLLKRIKDTKPQSALNPRERENNIKGAFAFNADKYNIQNKKILLVDDIYTTGSTISECGRILYKSGAAQVISATASIAVKKNN